MAEQRICTKYICEARDGATLHVQKDVVYELHPNFLPRKFDEDAGEFVDIPLVGMQRKGSDGLQSPSERGGRP